PAAKKDKDGKSVPPPDEEPGIVAAAEAARSADVAVVFVGTNDTVEHEGRDRTTLGLPGRQQDLVKAVVASNPRTVVVLTSAGPLAVPWLAEHVPAMLQAWWSGGDGGPAIADVLFGDANPAGRLPHTVYASDAQVPPQDQYDISQGFTYMYVKGEPLYAFGHGLSYTRFDYANLALSAGRATPADTLTVTAEITNAGDRPGDEVPQLYVRQVSPRDARDPPLQRPARQLMGFQRLALDAGERKIVSFTLPVAKLAFWDESRRGFAVEPGVYEIMVGPSSGVLPLAARLEIDFLK
ncbi:MAG: glycoside hydrolase family 3 C-terminal domain-containing protein, partial [Planctomycetota bacterium]